MTKEEIAEKETFGIFNSYELGITGLANAMEIYAEQTALEFDEFKRIQYWQWNYSKRFWFRWETTGEMQLSPKQLYSHYLASKENIEP